MELLEGGNGEKPDPIKAAALAGRIAETFKTAFAVDGEATIRFMDVNLEQHAVVELTDSKRGLLYALVFKEKDLKGGEEKKGSSYD
ncbi:MAG: hypothetical protein ACYTEQ_03550 [Planctomycetota bacterium]|jgi:hypothetical protein